MSQTESASEKTTELETTTLATATYAAPISTLSGSLHKTWPNLLEIPSGEIMSEQPERPNVLLIMTDQHRHDLMTCAGKDVVPTPNVDRIAERGLRLENTYCPYPVCVASRMAMLTGLHAHQAGAIDNTDFLDWRYRTMAHHFSDNGYLTGLIGKMHFGDAHNHGFDYYLSINDWLMYLGPRFSTLPTRSAAIHQTRNTSFARCTTRAPDSLTCMICGMAREALGVVT